MEYASKAVGNAGLTTGIIGTALGAMAQFSETSPKKKKFIRDIFNRSLRI